MVDLMVVPTERELVTKWNKMHPGERFFQMQGELRKAFESMGARGNEHADFYAKEAAKSKFSDLTEGERNMR